LRIHFAAIDHKKGTSQKAPCEKGLHSDKQMWYIIKVAALSGTK
jgi:hypothetical protein